MDHASWKELKTQLGRLLNRDVRIFSDKKIEQFEEILRDPDPQVAANRLATELRNSPLEGDVLRQVRLRFEKVLGKPIPLEGKDKVVAQELSAWTPAPESTTRTGES